MAQEKKKSSNKKKKVFKFNGKSVPTSPGCYLFFNPSGQLLYVGKAKHLRKRVSSYFQKKKVSPKVELLVSKIAKIETRTVNSETEALILENNLIKEFRPRFNVLLRDDKNFLYLRITNEDVPRLEITRRIVRDGSFYFGPKTSAKKFRATISFCQKVFQVRTCKLEMGQGSSECRGRGDSTIGLSKSSPQNKANSTSRKKDISEELVVESPPCAITVLKNPENRKIPCMDFHVKKCSAPCANEITAEDYQAQVELMKRFLRGNTGEVLKTLKDRMMNFAQQKNFEAAAKMRDLIGSVEASTQKQRVQFSDLTNRDFVHFYRGETECYFVRLAFRNGKFLDQNEVVFQARETAEDGEVLKQFLLQFYERIDEPPSEIYLPTEVEDGEEVVDFLVGKYFPECSLKLLVPQKGEKKKILEMALKNAKHFAKTSALEELSRAENFAHALPKLAEALDLKAPPKRIECFDVSHWGGTSTVASQVVFVDGQPKKSEYRRFNVKALPDGKIDDFAAMEEVLTRRFKKADDKKFAEKFPDLIVIDGGKGQLSSVMKAVKNMPKVKKFRAKKQIIALAKKEEEIFRPGVKDSLLLPGDHPGLQLLQRLRDEAHRFAISHNKVVREKKAAKSVLDDIAGLGPATKKKLLQTFGSVSGIRKASDEALAKVLNKKQLENVRKMI